MSKNYIYDIVNDLMEKYGTKDPYELADALGIKVIEDDISPLQGAFYVIFDQPVIFINKNLSDDQKKQVLAHEIGHCVLHIEVVKAGSLAEFEVYDMREPIEYEANVFAAHLLIDDDTLLNILKKGLTVFQAAMILHVNVNLISIKLSEMNGWGYNFDTSWGSHDLFT